MSGYGLTPLAKADIFEIWSYIARDSVEAADRVEQAIYDACALLAKAPWSGHVRQDVTNRPLRFWTLVRYPNYIIVYLPEEKPLRVVAILHGKEHPQRFAESSVTFSRRVHRDVTLRNR